MTASLAYRKHEAAIWDGAPPEKYLRLLPFIPGRRIVELGSAEGVLALLLARRGADVIAIEASAVRHETALRLEAHWRDRFDVPGEITFVNATAGDSLGLFTGADTVVAVRMIYYLGADLDPVFAAASTAIPEVVLCGNKNRAARWRDGEPDKPGGPANYYASAEGMTDLLQRHGYDITTRIEDGDPIVVGRRNV